MKKSAGASRSCDTGRVGAHKLQDRVHWAAMKPASRWGEKHGGFALPASLHTPHLQCHDS